MAIFIRLLKCKLYLHTRFRRLGNLDYTCRCILLAGQCTLRYHGNHGQGYYTCDQLKIKWMQSHLIVIHRLNYKELILEQIRIWPHHFSSFFYLYFLGELYPLGPIYTKSQCQCCDNSVIMLTKLFSLKTMKSFENGLQLYSVQLHCFQSVSLASSQRWRYRLV